MEDFVCTLQLIQIEIKTQSTLEKTILFKYDGLGRLIEKKIIDSINSLLNKTRRFTYDGSNILFETDQTGRIIAVYLHGPGIDNPIAMVRDHNKNNNFEDNEIFTYTKDHLGSIRELTNKDQKLVQRYDYSAYGFTTLEKTENQNTNIEYVESIYAHTGKFWLQDTGDYFHEVRWRNQDRFLSPDPSGLKGGMNAYLFGKNSPIMYRDPDGKIPAIAVAGLWGGVIGGTIGYFGSNASCTSGKLADAFVGMVTGAASSALAAVGAGFGSVVAKSVFDLSVKAVGTNSIIGGTIGSLGGLGVSAGFSALEQFGSFSGNSLCTPSCPSGAGPSGGKGEK